jgi:hypothetical protein
VQNATIFDWVRKNNVTRSQAIRIGKRDGHERLDFGGRKAPQPPPPEDDAPDDAELVREKERREEYTMRKQELLRQHLALERLISNEDFLERVGTDKTTQGVFDGIAERLTQNAWFLNASRKREKEQEQASTAESSTIGPPKRQKADDSASQPPPMPVTVSSSDEDEAQGGTSRTKPSDSESTRPALPPPAAPQKPAMQGGSGGAVVAVDSDGDDEDDEEDEMDTEAAVGCSDGVSAQRVRPSSSVSSVEKQLGRAMALHSHAWHTQPHWWQR